VQLGVISQHRFDDSTIALRNAITDGRLGTPLFGAAVVRWWREQSYYDVAPWRGTLRLDGGALLNQGVHHVDLMLWLLGPAKRVYARYATAAHEMECEDLALLTVDFAGGALGTIEVTTAAYPGFAERLSITGSNGTVAIEGTDIATWGLREPQSGAAASNGHGDASAVAAADPAGIGNESHRRQVADFVDAVRNNRAPAVTGEDGRRALELILAARESHRTGQPVGVGAAAVAS
jgi:predicted dehydrogenase